MAESKYGRLRTVPTGLHHFTWPFLVATLPAALLSRAGHPDLGPLATVIAGTGVIVARRRWERAHPVADPDSRHPPG